MPRETQFDDSVLGDERNREKVDPYADSPEPIGIEYEDFSKENNQKKKKGKNNKKGEKTAQESLATTSPEPEPVSASAEPSLEKEMTKVIQEIREGKIYGVSEPAEAASKPIEKTRPPEARYKNTSYLWKTFYDREATLGDKLLCANLLLKHYGESRPPDLKDKLQQVADFISNDSKNFTATRRKKEYDGAVKQDLENQEDAEWVSEKVNNMINRLEWNSSGTRQNLGEKRDPNEEKRKAEVRALYSNMAWVVLSEKGWKPEQIEKFIEENSGPAAEIITQN